MDTLRVIQLVTDLAYFLLGVAAVRAALRKHERVRTDVALVFGTLAAIVIIQEVALLSCTTVAGCVAVPFSAVITVVLIMALPYLMLRLVDDIRDVPEWHLWLTLVLGIALAIAFIVTPAPPPGWLVLLLLVYLLAGSAYGALAFVDLARSAIGITRRRMAAVAWGFGMIVATFALSLFGQAVPFNQSVFMPLSRLTALVSGLCFWAGFFPPNWLSQTWRLPELLEYLRPARLMATAPDGGGVVTEALQLDRLTMATAQTTGARRALLILFDPQRHDLYLWGAPSARMPHEGGLIGLVFRSGRPRVAQLTSPNDLPPAVMNVFATETLPRTAMLVPIVADGRQAGVLAAFADKGPMFVEDDLEIVRFFAGEAAAILQLRTLREATSELEALREADRLKDEFMAVVSHELRTPLTAISGYADILMRKLSGQLNDRQEKQVVGIRDASRRLLALINDLLDVSKLEAGTLDLHLEAIDAEGAITRAITGTRVIAATKGVTMTLRDPAPDLPRVRADEDRLQQILSNLLVNSIKFTPQGGSVWVGAAVEDRMRNGQPVSQDIAFRVEDTGVGLTQGQVERIWDRFYQAESSSTRRFGGAGLGLSIVRRLAELHDGNVEAASGGVDRGSTFVVRIPAALPDGSLPDAIVPFPVEEEEGPAPPLPPSFVPGGDLVLVVEDDPHIATVLRTYLENEGFNVETVGDGQQAIQAARASEPFAITLDISLPRLDGWSVLNALKRDPATADVPVVIISIVDNRDFGMVLGATEYLVKPIDHERLQAVLRMLRSNRAPGQDSSVLVVDDDPDVRDVLCSMLIQEGWRAVPAENGEAALQAIERRRPMAVLLDLMMPGVDGFEVIRQMRERPETRDLPVIVVTAKDLTDEENSRLNGAVEGVILKHAKSMDDLLLDVRAALQRHRDDGSFRQRTIAGGRST